MSDLRLRGIRGRVVNGELSIHLATLKTLGNRIIGLAAAEPAVLRYVNDSHRGLALGFVSVYYRLTLNFVLPIVFIIPSATGSLWFAGIRLL